MLRNLPSSTALETRAIAKLQAMIQSNHPLSRGIARLLAEEGDGVRALLRFSKEDSKPSGKSIQFFVGGTIYGSDIEESGIEDFADNVALPLVPLH